MLPLPLLLQHRLQLLLLPPLACPFLVLQYLCLQVGKGLHRCRSCLVPCLCQVPVDLCRHLHRECKGGGGMEG